jgi:cell division protein ZapE
LAAGALRPDPAQAAVVERLQALHAALRGYRPGGRQGGLLRRLGLSAGPAAAAPRGLYLHGPVGRGKSMLMDWLHETAPIAPKRRVHFHRFMLEVHERLAALRASAPARADALAPVAAALAAEATLLCFDEFHVQNIADAMILGRLFDGLHEAGVVVVATSNFPPERLYEGGLNRDRFLPFIARLQERLEVVALDGGRDYRVARLRDLPVYHAPLDQAAGAALEGAFALLTDGAAGAAEQIAVQGRVLPVPKAARGVAWFDFAELCARPLGAADYLALTERYHTLILAGVPVFTPERRNEARRFMTLVDALYECRINLIMSAAAPAAALHATGEGAFEFQRTVSRLMEMQSRAYLETPPRSAAARRFTPFALTSDLI